MLPKTSKNQEVVKPLVPDKINYKKVRSRIEAKLSYTGRESGKLYEWDKAGQEVPVLEEDIPELLSKRLGGKACCGNEDTNIIFELA